MDTKIAAFAAQLTKALEVDSRRPKRDRRTARKLFQEIQALGFEGDYSRVTEFVRRWRQAGGHTLVKAFVPLRFELGDAHGPGEGFKGDVIVADYGCWGLYKIPAIFLGNPTPEHQ